MDEIVAVLGRFADRLRAEEDRLNELNVFPIADGDTGTNLRRTVDGILATIDASDGDDLASVITRAGLLAARGNSGLIFTQYLAGLVEAPGDVDIAARLERAATLARAAVSEPVEGTMLTVADAAARGAAAMGSMGAVVAEARAALARTPELLAVLADAGVVDAGGAGLVLFFEAMADVAVAPREVSPSAVGGPTVEGAIVGYELQFLLVGDEALADRVRRLLAASGDDVVVSHGGGDIAAHVHLRTVGEVGGVLEAVLVLGRPRSIDIEPLIERGLDRAAADADDRLTATRRHR